MEPTLLPLAVIKERAGAIGETEVVQAIDTLLARVQDLCKRHNNKRLNLSEVNLISQIEKTAGAGHAVVFLNDTGAWKEVKRLFALEPVCSEEVSHEIRAYFQKMGISLKKPQSVQE
jgi:hypothetical protein